MAETIPEHIPALGASPSRDMDTADYEAHYDDAEYPFAQGVLNGAKCCSRCGATKTPQWREGPFGKFRKQPGRYCGGLISRVEGTRGPNACPSRLHCWRRLVVGR